MNKQIRLKIREKREFSQLPEKDIEMAYEQFAKRQVSEEEKINLTKELLRKVFSMFTSRKLLSFKNKDEEWILRKHISTRERLPYYKEIYERVLKNISKPTTTPQPPTQKISIIDLGAGINGFSYKFFKQGGVNVNYSAIESIGQLVDLMNLYFKKEKISGKAYHFSLLESDKIKKLVEKQEKPRIVFLFKVIDSLELLERHFSKRLLLKLVPLVDKIVVSFATRTLIRRKKFRWERNWLVNFIKHNFNILDDFEFGSERYLVFSKTKPL